MNTKRAYAGPVDTSRTVTPTMTANGRHIERGQELTVTGIRGRVVFRQHVRHVDGAEWVDVITSRGRARSVRPDTIRTVHLGHRLGVTTGNLTP